MKPTFMRDMSPKSIRLIHITLEPPFENPILLIEDVFYERPPFKKLNL